jgi:hypothetical protein
MFAGDLTTATAGYVLDAAPVALYATFLFPSP